MSKMVLKECFNKIKINYNHDLVLKAHTSQLNNKRNS